MYLPKYYLYGIFICSLLGLQACSSTYEKVNNEMHKVSNERIQQAQALARQTRSVTPLVSDERVVRFTSRSIPLVRSATRTYLRSVTAGTTGTNGIVTGPSLAVADLISGFNLSMLPAILDSNRVLLETSVGISSLRELTQYSTGTGNGQTVLQQPNVDNFQNVQRVTMNLGETVVCGWRVAQQPGCPH